MLLRTGFFANRLTNRRLVTGTNVGKTPFTLPGFHGECPQLVTVPVGIMWFGVLVQNSDSLEQQHKPLAMKGISLISQVYCNNAEQMQLHHGQGKPQ